MSKHKNISIKIFESSVSALQAWDENGTTIDVFLDEIDKDIPIRKSVSSLLFAFFRNKTTVDKTISKFTQSVKTKHYRILAIAITQMFYQDGIVAESAGNIAVTFAKEKYGQGIAGFVNAILRNISRQKDDFFKEYDSENKLPEILFDKWEKVYGLEKTTFLSKLFMKETPLTFRTVNDFTLSDSDISSLKAKPIEFEELDKTFNFYTTDNPSVLFSNNWLQEGNIYIQDPVTALAPMSVNIKDGSKVLDMCAAPGGKSLIILEHFNCSLTAADISSTRLELLKENIIKYDYDVKIVRTSALHNSFDNEQFDVILLDVPCSNTGVFRKRPDALWNFSHNKMVELVALQKEILNSTTSYLAKNGKIIYSTCSIEKEENETQIQDFLKNNTNFILEKEIKLLPTNKHDGCFVAVLKHR